MSEPPTPSADDPRPSTVEGRDSPFRDERDTADRVVAGLAVLGTALRTREWEGAAEQDLNPTQGRILALLDRADPEGATLAYLAQRLGVSRPTASDSVSALQRKGLVEKGRHPSDGRALAIRLTGAGADAARSTAAWPDEVMAVVGGLPPEEQAVLLKTLVVLVRELQERDLVAPARTCVTCRFFRPNAAPGSERPHFCDFAGAHFGDASLRLDCRDHDPADPESARRSWTAFREGGSG